MGFGTTGSTDSAWAKAQAINAKINETGVQAKATTEIVVKVLNDLSTADLKLNGTSIAKGDNIVTNAAQLASVINNGSLAQYKNIKAEVIDTDEVRIIALDGRNLSLTQGTATSTLIAVNGMTLVSTRSVTNRGTLTLSNARAMVNGDAAISAGTINSGDLVINGVDIASSGSLTIQANDEDLTLLNAINNNEELQKLGIRAELYSTDSGSSYRIRLISE
ncbi:hypothetical protein, partial [Dissulfuribacter thermophilus]|uniref:hypothetical protein n=1 Tax=Dissulfuribacter thermophilus TaxID=1156395 RepID=UPI00244671F3